MTKEILLELLTHLNSTNNLESYLTDSLLLKVYQDIHTMDFLLREATLSKGLFSKVIDKRRFFTKSNSLFCSFEKEAISYRLEKSKGDMHILHLLESIPVDVTLKDMYWLKSILESKNFSLNLIPSPLLMELKNKDYFQFILRNNKDALVNSKLEKNFEASFINWEMINSKLDNYFKLSLENKSHSYILNSLIEKIENINKNNSWGEHVSDFVKLEYQRKIIGSISKNIEEAEEKLSHLDNFKHMKRENYREAIVSIGGAFQRGRDVDDYVEVIKKRMFFIKSNVDVANIKYKHIFSILTENMNIDKVATTKVIYEIVFQYNDLLKSLSENNSTDTIMVNIDIVDNLKNSIKLFQKNTGIKLNVLKDWVKCDVATGLVNRHLDEYNSKKFNMDMIKLEILLFNYILEADVPVSALKSTTMKKF